MVSYFMEAICYLDSYYNSTFNIFVATLSTVLQFYQVLKLYITLWYGMGEYHPVCASVLGHIIILSWYDSWGVW